MTSHSYALVKQVQVLAEPQYEQISFVKLGYWRFADGRTEWCLECVDSVDGDVREDECFASAEEAMSAAEAEFGFDRSAWRD